MATGERVLTAAAAADGTPRVLGVLRLGLGVVFLWFGALKFVPGLSPAEGLVARTVCWAVDPAWFLPVLAAWECAIGLGLLLGRFLPATLALMGLHMAGTFLPLVVCPETVWTRFPYAFTLEGQYIVKNLVLVAAGLVLAFPGGVGRRVRRQDQRSRKSRVRTPAAAGSRVPRTVSSSG